MANLFVSYYFYNKESKYSYEALTGELQNALDFVFFTLKHNFFKIM
jgi:hypothetical protein